MIIFVKTFKVIILVLFSTSIILAQSIESKFQHILDSVYQINQDAVGILIHVESPNRNISWTSSVGVSEKGTQNLINTNQPALIASNTKTYVAASILKLVERGDFKLEEPIKKLITRKTCKLLKKDGYSVNDITVKHLLSHTSGIADYVDDAYFDFVKEHPKYQWNRQEQIERSTHVGDPLGRPGESFSYGDINFLLLTEILERKTKMPFFKAIRALIDFKKHQLNATWFKTLETEPEGVGPMLHQYSDKHDWSSYDLNPSWDLYGGGGLASTVSDLAFFFQLLFEGKIIKDQDLLEQMHTFVLPEEDSNYSLGLRKINFFKTDTAYYHGGYWGTDVMYLPEVNTTISSFTLKKEKRVINAHISNALLKLLKDN